MDHADVEFLAENERVKIVPNFKHETMYLISGDFGPFIPGLPVEVPMWFAKDLLSKQQCQLLAPDWLNHESFLHIKETEIAEKSFTKLPSKHFFELSKLILSLIKDQIPDADKMRILSSDIWDVRSAKLKTSTFKFIQSGAGYANVDNLTKFEVNNIQPILTGSLDELHKAKQALLKVQDRMAATQ